MSISQAGIYKLTLYENKGFTFFYNSDGTIDFDTISNSGDVLEFETNHNSPKYSNNLVPAGNNNVLNDYLLSLEINGFIQSNIDTLEKLTSSIYGWIPLIEFMNNDKYLIKVPFFEKVNAFNSQITHTFFIELKPAVFSIEKLQSVVESTGVQGLLNFDGVDDRVDLALHPDVTGSKPISFYIYLKTNGVTQAEDIFVFGSNNSDYLDVTYITNVERLRIAVSTSGGSVDYDISGIMNSIALIEVVKTAGAIVSTKANNIDLPVVSSGSGNSAASVSTIGHHPDVGVFKYLGSAYVWSILIDGIVICDGQPDGNLSPAWSQSIAATVYGSPSTIDLP